MIRDQIRAVIEPLQHGSNLDAATDAVMDIISRKLKLADDIVENFMPIFEAARPLILNGERLREYSKVKVAKACNRCDDGMTINENFRTKEPCRHCQ